MAKLDDFFTNGYVSVFPTMHQGRPALCIGYADDAPLGHESFAKIVLDIGMGGRRNYRPEDIREMKAWKKAFAEASKLLERRIRQATRNPD